MFVVAFNCADLLRRAFCCFNSLGFVVQGCGLLVFLRFVARCSLLLSLVLICCVDLFCFSSFGFVVHAFNLLSCDWLRDVRCCFQLCWFVARSLLLFQFIRICSARSLLTCFRRFVARWLLLLSLVLICCANLFCFGSFGFVVQGLLSIVLVCCTELSFISFIRICCAMFVVAFKCADLLRRTGDT